MISLIVADKQVQVSSEDYGRDLSSVQILITKEVCIQKHSLTFMNNFRDILLILTSLVYASTSSYDC